MAIRAKKGFVLRKIGAQYMAVPFGAMTSKVKGMITMVVTTIIRINVKESDRFKNFFMIYTLQNNFFRHLIISHLSFACQAIVKKGRSEKVS